MATEMVLEGFELSRGFELPGWVGLQLEVEGYDPLTGTVTIQNNKLSSGTDLIVGFVFGTYDDATKTFSVITYVKDSTTYAWGSYKPQVDAPSKGGTKDVDVETYALNPSSETTVDIMAFVGPYNVDGTAVLRYDSRDWGSGSRVIGINWSDLQTYLSSHVYDTEIYLDQVKVKPWTPAAEVTNFSIEKA